MEFSQQYVLSRIMSSGNGIDLEIPFFKICFAD